MSNDTKPQNAFPAGPYTALETLVFVGQRNDYDDDGKPLWGGFDVRGCPRAAALAQLLSAAPELLEALEGLLRLHQASDRETTPEEIAAEYAIAKARGLK